MKHYCILFSILLLLLGSCQTVEHLSIDYMLPAEVSFPSTLKRVAVINNTPEARTDSLRAGYYYGDAAITTEALAETLAERNYFDEVIICDSNLHKNAVQPEEGILTMEETNRLLDELDADFLIAVENVLIHAAGNVAFVPEWGMFQGIVDAKVYPTLRIYLPHRRGPMVTVNCCDSIYWEAYGSGEEEVYARLVGEKEIVEQASDFAGIAPVKHLLPTWKTADRYVFGGGSVEMRDAMVFAREQNWQEAIRLWERVYNRPKGKAKMKMQAAYNMALGYEMQDSIGTAHEWAMKAQALAIEIKEMIIPTSVYASELEERLAGLVLLQTQMRRFEEE